MAIALQALKLVAWVGQTCTNKKFAQNKKEMTRMGWYKSVTMRAIVG
jgi:hypothetical protein